MNTTSVDAGRPARSGLAGPGRVLWLLLLAGLAMALAACASGSGGDGRLLTYERAWPDGRRDDQTIWADGRLQMHHGDQLERLTLTAAEVKLITEALEREIPVGPPEDSPKRTLTRSDGKVLADVLPKPGTVTELLDRLLDTHSLGESQEMEHSGASPHG